MTTTERQEQAKARATRIRKMYARLRKVQPLATKTAIVSHIAQQEGCTIVTALRAVNEIDQ